MSDAEWLAWLGQYKEWIIIGTACLGFFIGYIVGRYFPAEMRL